MKPEDRVLDALNLEEPDRVPFFDFLYEHGSFENILGRKIEKVTPDIIVEGHKALGVDLMAVNYDPPDNWEEKYVNRNIKVDEWGVKYREVEEMKILPWYLEGPIKNEEEANLYIPPDPDAPGRFRTLNKVLELVEDRMAVSLSVSGPLTVAWMLMGPNYLFKAMASQLKVYYKVMEMATDFIVKIIHRAMKEKNINLIFLAEDLGDVHGPFCSPKTFCEKILPFIKRVIREVKSHNGYLLLHCDGNINPILGYLVDAGIDAYHPVERKAGMNLKEVKERYGDKICLIGNVDASTTLPFGSSEEIAKQVDECLRIAAPGGGYILASDHSIHPGIPGEKAKLLFKIAKKKSTYPFRRILNNI